MILRLVQDSHGHVRLQLFFSFWGLTWCALNLNGVCSRSQGKKTYTSQWCYWLIDWLIISIKGERYNKANKLKILLEQVRQHKTFWRTNLVWVPVTVEDDDGVGSLQVEAEAAGSGAEQEDEVLRSFLIKFLQQCRSVLGLGGSWNIKNVPHLWPVKALKTGSVVHQVTQLANTMFVW